MENRNIIQESCFSEEQIIWKLFKNGKINTFGAITMDYSPKLLEIFRIVLSRQFKFIKYQVFIFDKKMRIEILETSASVGGFNKKLWV